MNINADLIKTYKRARDAAFVASTRRMESHAAHDAWVKRRDELVKAALALGDAIVAETEATR